MCYDYVYVIITLILWHYIVMDYKYVYNVYVYNTL